VEEGREGGKDRGVGRKRRDENSFFFKD